MRATPRWSLLLAAATLAACARQAAVNVEVDPWSAYWARRGVEPAPPRDFLEYRGPMPRILNLTDGIIDDRAVLAWVKGDLRRGTGDDWAVCNLRPDVADAGVLGPKGLNGTDASIEEFRARGAVKVECGPHTVIEKVAVIAVPKSQRRLGIFESLTEFVIVLQYRHDGEGNALIHEDGRREALAPRGPKDSRSWQLDTGDFRNDSIVGPLWYQANGWRCDPNRVYPDQADPIAHICARILSR